MNAITVPSNYDVNFDFNMKEFVMGLGRIGESIFTGVSCTLGHTQLYMKSRQLGKQATELCDQGVLLVGHTCQVICDVPSNLEVAFEFLKNSYEDLAIKRLKQIGESCDTLARETIQFKVKVNSLQTSVKDVKAKIKSTYKELWETYNRILAKEEQQNQAERIFNQKLEEIQDNIRKVDEKYQQAIKDQKDLEEKISQIKVQRNERQSNMQEDIMENDLPSHRAGFQNLIQSGFQILKIIKKEILRFIEKVKTLVLNLLGLGPKNKFEQKLKDAQRKMEDAQRKVEEAGFKRKEQYAAEVQLRQQKIQEEAAQLGQKYEVKDDPSLLLEGDPFFDIALQHTQKLMDNLEGAAQLWATMGESYSKQLPEKISLQMGRTQEEREKYWKSDEFLQLGQNCMQTWTMLKNQCNVINEMRIAQDHVLSYVGNEPTNIDEVNQLLAKEKEKLQKNANK